jgi:hypothetical protein
MISKNKIKVSVLFLISFLVLLSCTKKEITQKIIPLGFTVDFFSEPSSGLDETETKCFKVNDLTLTFEKIDRDRYEIEKSNILLPKALSLNELPDSIKNRIEFTKDGNLTRVRLKNGEFKSFLSTDENKETFKFNGYFPSLNIISVASNDLEAIEVIDIEMTSGKISHNTPSDYSPDLAYRFEIDTINDGLQATLTNTKVKKPIINLQLSNLESGFAPEGYETAWINKNTALLKVEAYNQDQDQYWILRISK